MNVSTADFITLRSLDLLPFGIVEPTGLIFNDDGTKLYVTDSYSIKVL